MPLTKEQTLAAAQVVALAFGAGGVKKVATPKGSLFYHLPIGALIVAHGKATMSTGASIGSKAEAQQDQKSTSAKGAVGKGMPPEPQTMPHGWIPEAKWLEGQAEWEAIWKANEWKGHGTKHIWSSGHLYSVPDDADVWVPHGTDVDNDHAVAEAKKFVVIGEPGEGKAAALTPNGKFQEVDLTDAFMDQLKAHGTKMADDHGTTHHMPVQAGDATHWIPEGWHAYTLGKGLTKETSVYAQDPEGHWHTITSKGVGDKWVNAGSEQAMTDKVADGSAKPYEHQTGEMPEHTPAPVHAPEGKPTPGSTTIAGTDGPISVTYDQIADALSLLNNDGSTQVKKPLQAAGHPLVAMDYHLISKQVLKDHPELKLAKGTKQAHVGQVKSNILWYLGNVLAEQPGNDAQEAQAEQAQQHAEDVAVKSEEIAPTTVTLGGVEPKSGLKLKPKAEPAPEPAPKTYKQVTLPSGQAHKVPSDWDVYQSTVITPPPDYLHAQDPQGHWHTINKNGVGPVSPTLDKVMDQQMGTGEYKLYEPSATASEAKPAGPVTGPFKAGDHVTDTGTGHSGEVVSASPGSTAAKQYVSYLDGKGGHHSSYAQTLVHTSSTAGLEKPQTKAEEHAAAVAEASTMVGGVDATHAQIQDAIAALEAHPTSTAIKQILKGANNPLANADYWKIIHQYADETGASTKGKARELFIAALKHYFTLTKKGDVNSHTDVAQELAKLVHNTPKLAGTGGPDNFGYTIAKALQLADTTGQTLLVVEQAANPGTWTWGLGLPSEVKGFAYQIDAQNHVTPFDHGVQHGPQWDAKTTMEIALPHLQGEDAKPSADALDAVHAAEEAEEAQHAEEVAFHEANAAAAHEASEYMNPDQEAEQEAEEEAKAAYEHTVPIKIDGDVVASVEEGSKIYYSVPALASKFSAPTPEDASVKYVKEPNGSWWRATATGYEMLPAKPSVESWGQSWDEAVEKGLLKEISAWKPPADTVALTAAGVQMGDIPAKALIYGFPDNTTDRWVKYPNGDWYIFDSDNKQGKKLDTAAHMQSAIDDGTVVLYDHNDQKIASQPDAPPSIKDKENAEIGSLILAKAEGAQGAGVPLSQKLAAALILAAHTDGSYPYLPADQIKSNVQHSILKEGNLVWVVPTGHAGWKIDQAGEDLPSSYFSVGPDGKVFMATPNTDHASVNVSEPVAILKAILNGHHDWENGVPKGETPEPEAAPESPPEPEKTPVILSNGKLAKDGVPPGSKLYTAKPAANYYIKGEMVAHTPDGKWLKVTQYSTGDAPGYYKAQEEFEAGNLTEVTQSEEDVAHAVTRAAYVKKLRTGSIKKSESQKGWQQALVAKLAEFGNSDVEYGNTITLWHNPDGKWVGVYNLPSGTPADHVVISGKTFTGTYHYETGAESPITFDQVIAAIDEHLVPDSVLVDGAQYKYGNYFSTKGKGAYLEIKSGGDSSYGYNSNWKYGNAAAATYVWHKADGDKQNITPTAAAKKLEGALDFHPPGETPTYEPKKNVPTPAMSKWATIYTGKEDQSGFMGGTSTNNVYTLHPDGTATISYTETGTKQQLTHFNALTTGDFVDGYGNTILEPGTTPDIYYLFGQPHDKAFIEGLQANIQMNSGDKSWIAAELKEEVLTSAKALEQAKSWWTAKIGNGKDYGFNWEEQRDAVLGLLNAMLTVPTTDAALLKVKPEASFLKSLPEGISGPADIFHFNAEGFAAPYDDNLPHPSTLITENAGVLGDYIKGVSGQYGNGKVVGTHVASMSKGERIAWLKAWAAGDMETVFAIDAGTGKVSHAHPGAPDNPATHTVTWAPWGEGEKPAGQIPEGNWSDNTKVTVPKAEIDNYIIKAGLKHSEYLPIASKREWVKQHRLGDQYEVNVLSRQAYYAWKNHQAPVSEPPVWTDNVQPAKSYDSFLEEKKNVASHWPMQATQDFIADHPGLIEPYMDQVLPDWTGKLSAQSSYYLEQAVQKYLDHLAAVEAAEKLKPKYHWLSHESDAKGVITDQFNNQYHFTAGADANREAKIAALARALGFKTPRAIQVTLESGEAGKAIEQLDGGTLAHAFPKGVKFTDFEPYQLNALAAEHVLDWVLDNPGTDSSAMVVTDNGSLVGSHKTGALSDPALQWKGLTATKASDTAAQLVYTPFYAAIRDHTISQNAADGAFVAAIRAAQRIQNFPEERFKLLLSGALTASLTPPDMQLLLDRRAALVKAIEKMWKGIYKDAGWTLPEIPAEKLPMGLHSGFSEPSFFDHVMAAKNSGVPAFFAGTDLEDANFLVQTELAGENRYITGETFIRSSVLDQLIQWAQLHEGEVSGAPGTIEIPGEAGFYQTIINAARAVSRHAADQLWEGPNTKASLEKLDALQTKMLDAKAAATNAADHGPESVWWNDFTALGMGDKPKVTLDMLNYYLTQIGKIGEAKDNHDIFHKGDLPKWEPSPALQLTPEEKNDLAKIKVEKRDAYRTLNEKPSDVDNILGEDGELHLGKQVYEYPGEAWYLTLPTGETIEINDGQASNTPLAHRGRVRFHALASEGSVSLERIRSQLQSMGLPLEEATPEDMELFYWRHLAHVLADRNDRTEGLHKKLWDTLAEATGKPAVTSYSDPEFLHSLAEATSALPAEADLWHTAWAKLAGQPKVDQWVADQSFMPHMGHYDIHHPEVTGGKPFWYDITADQGKIAKQQLIAHSMSSGEKRLLRMINSGGLLATEARLRELGLWKPGKSSVSDMGHGSSGGVFTYQGKEGGDGYHHLQVYMNPRVLARTSTYSFNSDHYGDINQRKDDAPFNYAKVFAMHSSGNETIIKDAVSFLDDVEFVVTNTDLKRTELISALHAAGITEIRGLPVEKRIVLGTNYHAAARDEAKALISSQATAGELFAHPGEAYMPPPSEKVSAEHSAVSTEAEEHAHADAMAAAGQHTVTADHSQASDPATVAQMFYHAPSAAASEQTNAQVKGEVAQRIADTMQATEEQMLALREAAGLSIQEHWGPDDRVRTVAGLIKTWAQTTSSPIAQALQNRAKELFGLTKDNLPALGTTGASNESGAAALESGFGALLDEFLGTMWQLSQQDMAEAGIDNVTLYRVMRFPSLPEWAQGHNVGDTITAPAQRPLASWAFQSENAMTAGTFVSSGLPVLVKTTVPRELILAYPRTGFGAYTEAEFIVLDANGEWELVLVGN